MIIKKENVQSFIIENYPGLDRIQVFTTDDGNGMGTLTVTCYGQAWTIWWGAMGEPISDFIRQADSGYIANCLFRGKRNVITKQSVERREEGYIHMIARAVVDAFKNNLK